MQHSDRSHGTGLTRKTCKAGQITQGGGDYQFSGKTSEVRSIFIGTYNQTKCEVPFLIIKDLALTSCFNPELNIKSCASRGQEEGRGS